MWRNGRRNGLKIRWGAILVRVRVPPPVPALHASCLRKLSCCKPPKRDTKRDIISDRFSCSHTPRVGVRWELLDVLRWAPDQYLQGVVKIHQSFVLGLSFATPSTPLRVTLQELQQMPKPLVVSAPLSYRSKRFCRSARLDQPALI